MRKLILAAAAVLLLSGCGSAQDSEEEIGRQIVVSLRTEITDEQRGVVEGRLRALPDVTAVTYTDGPTNFRKIQENAPAEAKETILEVGPDHWPASFTVTVKDADAVRRIGASTIPAELEKLPGVGDVVIRCTAVAELHAKPC